MAKRWNLGKLIKGRRKHMRLSQRALAEEVGMSDVWISNVETEKGKLSKFSFLTVMDALGVSPKLAVMLYKGVVSPGTIILEDGSLQEPNGLVRRADGWMFFPDGVTVKGNKMTLPDGTTGFARLENRKYPPDGVHSGLRQDPYGNVYLPHDDIEGAYMGEERHLLDTWRKVPDSYKPHAMKVLEGLAKIEDED